MASGTDLVYTLKLIWFQTISNKILNKKKQKKTAALWVKVEHRWDSICRFTFMIQNSTVVSILQQFKNREKTLSSTKNKINSATSAVRRMIPAQTSVYPSATEGIKIKNSKYYSKLA